METAPPAVALVAAAVMLVVAAVVLAVALVAAAEAGVAVDVDEWADLMPPARAGNACVPSADRPCPIRPVGLAIKVPARNVERQ